MELKTKECEGFSEAVQLGMDMCADPDTHADIVIRMRGGMPVLVELEALSGFKINLWESVENG